jgi:hypothetical protein
MPVNFEDLIPFFFIIPFFLVFGLAFGPLVVDGIRHSRLRANGESAEATIVKVQETGMRVNRQPRVKITLEVRPSMRSPYQAVTHKIVSYFEVSQYQVGAVMDVKFDPNAPQHVVIIGPKTAAEGWGAAFAGARPSMDFSSGGVSTHSAFVVDGKSYASADQLPPEARAALGKAANLLGDANQNGIPDMLENALGSDAQVFAASAEDRVQKLSDLKAMLDKGLITNAEYEAKKKDILDRM